MTPLDLKTAAFTGLFHVSLSRGSWGRTSSVLNFERMKYVFLCNFLIQNCSFEAFLVPTQGSPHNQWFPKHVQKDATSPSSGKSEAYSEANIFPDFSVLASMFHVNLCRRSCGPTGSVLNFEMMKHVFFCLNSVSRNAHLKLFGCQQRVPPSITGFKSNSKKCNGPKW